MKISRSDFSANLPNHRGFPYLLTEVFAVKDGLAHNPDDFEEENESICTISPVPNATGWTTDTGCSGYGLDDSLAELYIKAINKYLKKRGPVLIRPDDCNYISGLTMITSMPKQLHLYTGKSVPSEIPVMPNDVIERLKRSNKPANVLWTYTAEFSGKKKKSVTSAWIRAGKHLKNKAITDHRHILVPDDNIKVLVIDTQKDLDTAYTMFGVEGPQGTMLNYERIADDFDAMHITRNAVRSGVTLWDMRYDSEATAWFKWKFKSE